MRVFHRTSAVGALLAAAVTGAVPAAAQDNVQETACAAPVEIEGWGNPAKGAAATNVQDAARAVVVIGQSAELALARTPDVTYAVPPQRPAGSVSHGGIVQFSVPEEGVYRVAIDTAAWIEVVKDQTAMVSVQHGRGPDCSGVRKMVDYSLTPGDYLLEIIGNGSSSVRVLVQALPDQ